MLRQTQLASTPPDQLLAASCAINNSRQRPAALNVEKRCCRKWSAVSYKSGRAKAMNASFKLLSITRLLIFDSYGVLLLNCIGYLKPRCLMSGLNSSCAFVPSLMQVNLCDLPPILRIAFCHWYRDSKPLRPRRNLWKIDFLEHYQLRIKLFCPSLNGE